MKDNKSLLFRNRDFTKVWLGQVISQVGTQIYRMAIMWWLVSQGTGSAGVRSGMFMVISYLPAIIFVKPIGRWVDSLNTQHLLIWSDLVSTLSCLLLLGLNYWKPEYLQFGIFAVGFILATTQAIVDPGLQKALNALVAPEDTEKAVGLSSSTQSMAGIVGAVFGTVMIAVLGLTGTVFFNLVSYLACAILAAAATFNKVSEKPHSADETASDKFRMSDFPQVKNLLVAFGLLNFFMTPLLVTLPLYVRFAQNGSVSLLAVFETMLAVGAVVGSLMSSRVSGTLRKVILVCFLIVTGCFALLGISQNIILDCLACLALAGAVGVINVKCISYFQELIPEKFKGSFFAVLMSIVSVAVPVGFFLFGAICDYLPVQNVMFLQGIGILTVTAIFFLGSRNKKNVPAANLIREVAP